MSVSVAIQKACSTVGEGPHWDVKTQTLLYVDNIKGDIYRWNPVTNERHKLHLDGYVGFVTPRASEGLITGLEHSFLAVDWNGDILKTYGEVDQGTKNCINDGKCDSSGRLWAGTMIPLEFSSENQYEKASLFSLETDGTIKTQVQKINISNGIAWSSDNTVMYYVDSIPGKVYAFDFDIAAGTISNQRTAIDLSANLKDAGELPDGMCSDMDGKLWVAICNGSKVAQFDPETGKQIRNIDLPTARITSCCFGGPNLDELYVTSMNYGIKPKDIVKDDPLAGSIFKVTGLGVKGIVMYDYAG